MTFSAHVLKLPHHNPSRTDEAASTIALGAEARWILWSEDVDLEVIDLSFFLDFIDGIRRILVQDSTGMFSDRRVTTTYASLLAAGLLQSLVGDGASLDLAMVKVRFLF
jgi:hypothetical protein